MKGAQEKVSSYLTVPLTRSMTPEEIDALDAEVQVVGSDHKPTFVHAQEMTLSLLMSQPMSRDEWGALLLKTNLLPLLAGSMQTYEVVR